MKAAAGLLAAVVVIALIASAGEGDDNAEVNPSYESTPATLDRPEIDESEDAETSDREQSREAGLRSTEEVGRDICGHYSPEELAREYGSRNDPVDIAKAYAQDSADWAQGAAERGCIDGLLNRRSRVPGQTQASLAVSTYAASVAAGSHTARVQCRETEGGDLQVPAGRIRINAIQF